MKKLWLTLTLVAITAIGVYVLRNKIILRIFSPRSTQITQGIGFDEISQEKTIKEPIQNQNETSEQEVDLEVIAQNLEIPWEVAFLPDGQLLITERPGRVLKIGQDRTVIKIAGVHHIGEGGLLGMALHPNFESNQLVYLYLTSQDNGEVTNLVERYKLVNNQFENREVIFSGIKGAPYHDGGRIEFGPDGYLYITTGDAGDQGSAQDKNSINGTILRIKDDGSIPSDNPFGTAVYSYGHRNVQGITWDDEGNLWSTEHGPSGVRSGFDELNLINPGNNYGWPVVQGDENQGEMTRPVIHSGASDTWAPGDVEFVNGSLFFTGLRGEALYEAVLDGEKIIELKTHFRSEFGRLRAVRLGPDGYLYITTSNRDGRGSVNNGDDKLIRIHPRIFEK